MTMARNGSPVAETFADLLDQLGNVPPQRIRMRPPPGTATEQDLIALENERRKPLCELVDGVLVEKAMGLKESLLAGLILHDLWAYMERNDRGIVLGADGMLRLLPGLVRIPDVSFISWKRLPQREIPDEPIPDLVPDLAVEVISKGNTKAEMQRKLREYFLAGTQVVWLVYPKTQTAEVYTSDTKKRRVRKDQSLTAEALLPGFALPLKRLFRGRK